MSELFLAGDSFTHFPKFLIECHYVKSFDESENVMAADERMLIWTDPINNKNKFYHVVLEESGRVTARYGRVGDTGKTVDTGEKDETGFNRVIRKKKNKGYKEARIADSSSSSAMSQTALRDATQKTLLSKNSDPRLVALIDRLVAVNAHEIVSASGGKITANDGDVRTPLGLLTEDAIVDARNILNQLKKHRTTKLLGEYMTLVPQNVGRNRDWVDHFLSHPDDILKQELFLTQLEQSLQFAKARSSAAANNTSYEDLFAYRIVPSDDRAVFDDLLKKFKNSRNKGHSKSLYYARLENVYEFTNPSATQEFDEISANLGNVVDAWHGTRAMNLLSIASRGLKSPREMTGLVTTGAMFGRGIYSSTCSTKALGYSDSGVWGGKATNQHFMFFTKVALGNTLVPKSQSYDWERVLGRKYLDSSGKPYDSISATSGYRNLRNPETIVPSANQMNLLYLLEFSSRP